MGRVFEAERLKGYHWSVVRVDDKVDGGLQLLVAPRCDED